MIKISLHTFWNNVRSHDNQEIADEIFAAFDQEKMQFTSMDEANEHMLKKMIPAQEIAAQINGCHNVSNVASYMSCFMDETIGNKVEWLDKSAAPVEVRKAHTMRLANLNRSYARQKMCHPTKKSFVCYCQS